MLPYLVFLPYIDNHALQYAGMAEGDQTFWQEDVSLLRLYGEDGILLVTCNHGNLTDLYPNHYIVYGATDDRGR